MFHEKFLGNLMSPRWEHLVVFVFGGIRNEIHQREDLRARSTIYKQI